MEDKILRKCPVCKEVVCGFKEAREHAVENKHWGIYVDNLNRANVSVG